jgi:hypothetical protein
MRGLMLAGVVVLLLTVPAVPFAQSNSEVGTWKLNPVKSRSTPEGLIPKSATGITQLQGFFCQALGETESLPAAVASC